MLVLAAATQAEMRAALRVLAAQGGLAHGRESFAPDVPGAGGPGKRVEPGGGAAGHPGDGEADRPGNGAVGRSMECAADAPTAGLTGQPVPDENPLALAPRRGLVPVRLAGREALLLVTGVGPVNAALETGFVLGRYEISGLVNVGLAGSYDLSKAPLNAAVAAVGECFPEYGVAGTSGDGLACALDFPFPQWEDGGLRVTNRLDLNPDAQAASMGLRLPGHLVRGVSLTVAGVSCGPDRAHALAARYGALTENMEGFAAALACLSRGVAFLEVRTVSNLAGERDRSRWTLSQALRDLGEVTASLFAA